MKQAQGDLWTYPTDLRVITTNGETNSHGLAIMGKGCALEAVERYPWASKRLGVYLRKSGNHVYILNPPRREPDGTVTMPGLATFPVKEGWRNKARMDLIERSAHELVDLVTQAKINRVVLGRPGCGAGGLDWNDVHGLLYDLLDDRFTVITFPERLVRSGVRRSGPR